MSFIIYPAIDLIDGKCVRLYQGDYAKETIYEDDPISQALEFESDGAKWIHLVDLDAARTGSLKNTKVIKGICEQLSIPVQVGGCLLYTSPSPRDISGSRMPSSA